MAEGAVAVKIAAVSQTVVRSKCVMGSCDIPGEFPEPNETRISG